MTAALCTEVLREDTRVWRSVRFEGSSCWTVDARVTFRGSIDRLACAFDEIVGEAYLDATDEVEWRDMLALLEFWSFCVRSRGKPDIVDIFRGSAMDAVSESISDTDVFEAEFVMTPKLALPGETLPNDPWLFLLLRRGLDLAVR